MRHSRTRQRCGGGSEPAATDPPVSGANTATGPLCSGGGDGGHRFPRAALGKRTASEADDAVEAAPPAKRDCTTSMANDRQQTYLTTFRVRPL